MAKRTTIIVGSNRTLVCSSCERELGQEHVSADVQTGSVTVIDVKVNCPCGNEYSATVVPWAMMTNAVRCGFDNAGLYVRNKKKPQ